MKLWKFNKRSSTSVSYTHLDVYKRQVHIPRRLSEAAGPIFDVEETRQLRQLLNKLLQAIDNANNKTAQTFKG